MKLNPIQVWCIEGLFMFISKIKDWLKQPKNIAGLIISILVCIILLSSAIALNRPMEGETPTSASQVIFDKARELGCNKIALGHHGDDAIETLFLNMIHGSKIATFLPKQYMSRMDMTMIRPLVYLREKDIIRACERNNIPAVKRVCPNDGFTQREDIKQKLYKFYEEYPEAEDNFLRALYNEKQVSLWQKEDTI